MPKNWTLARIGDISSTNLRTYSLSEKWPYVNYLDTGNITENRIDQIQRLVMGEDPLPSRARRKVEVGDIIYSTVRPNQRHYGIIKEVLPNMLASTGFAVISPNIEKVDPDFLYYFLTRNEIVESLHAIGEQSVSAYPSIRPSDIENLEIALPPLPEQIEIGRTLRALDEKIAINTRINNHLEQIAQAIFKSWFVDFEPFKSENFIRSELGEIPAGWSIKTIESLSGKIAMGPFGSNIKVKTFVDSGVPIISGNHLKGIYLDELNFNFITEEHAQHLSNSIVSTGDIIFTHAGNIGQVSLIPEDCDYPYYMISQRQFFLRCDKTKALPEFVTFFFHSYTGQGKLLANASQTGVPSIVRPTSHLKSIAIVLPPIRVQLSWYETVKSMLRTLNSHSKENRNLALIRNTLLPRLMSGELSVSGIGGAA